MNKVLLREADNGFSLVELLLAMGIFAIGSLAVVALFYSTSGSIRQSNQRSEAVFIAEDYLARTVALKYRNTTSGTCSDCMRDLPGTIPVDTSGENPKNNYIVNVDVTPDNPLANDTATITVTVTWPKIIGVGTDSYSLMYVRAESSSSGI